MRSTHQGVIPKCLAPNEMPLVAGNHSADDVLPEMFCDIQAKLGPIANSMSSTLKHYCISSYVCMHYKPADFGYNNRLHQKWKAAALMRMTGQIWVMRLEPVLFALRVSP